MAPAEHRSPISLPAGPGPLTVRRTLEHQVEACLEAHRQGRAEIAALLRGHRLDALTPETAKLLVAHEHGFRDWADAMAHGDTQIDPNFEAAIDAVVDGDLEALQRLLEEHPGLSRARSAFGHRSTLLHYVAANGVENTKQRSPKNAPAIARALLHAGAEPDALSGAYGGTGATIDLLVSSDHPATAGVQADLIEVLCRGGAKVEGWADDGSPLWGAITWGYTRAAERLVACGARVDNLITAAVVGTLEQVQSYFGADGRVRPIEHLRGEKQFSHGRPVDLRHLLEYALIEAAAHGRRDVVEFLLTKGPDLDVREPVYQNTALDGARYSHPAAGRPNGSPEIVALLEAARH
jgi:hypothetical protein